MWASIALVIAGPAHMPRSDNARGILLAPLTAQLVADLLLDDKVDPLLASIDPARFGVL